MHRIFLKHRIFLSVAAIFVLTTTAFAQTVYPVDRADILAGSRFDVKVEFPGLVSAADVKVTVNGVDAAQALGQPIQFIDKEDGKDLSALVLRDVTIDKPGTYAINVSAPSSTRDLTWHVYDAPARKAKNVILLIGDGLSLAHRVAARVLSRGIAEGKAFGKLAMDDMPHMALVSTAGTDSIITDSANSASAYATGHKTAAQALGVYADRSINPFDDPKVETISSLVKRRNGMSVGIVTNTEIQDATPAAMMTHTRRRAAYDQITEQFLNGKPDVLMGGGAANFLPIGAPGARRRDEDDYIAKFRDAGYAFAANAAELRAVPHDTRRLLGLFANGNMDGVLDRKFLKRGTVSRFPDQPDLTNMTAKALDVLSQNPNGFFLMVESGMIDKYTHLLDMERAIYDTIMFDNVVRLVKDWAKAHGDDTLVLVIADHTHSVSIVGTIEDETDSTQNAPKRERVRTYARAGFPNYPTPDADGYPSRIDVSRRLAMFAAGLPDPAEPFRPRLTSSVHSGEDVLLTAMGPGSEAVRGQLENTDVFRIMAQALGLAAGGRATSRDGSN